MIEIKVKDNSQEAFSKAMALFKKKCNKSGFLKEIRDRKYYKKPSDKKRETKRQTQRMIKNQNKKRKRKY